MSHRTFIAFIAVAAALAGTACGTLGDTDAPPDVLKSISGALSDMDGVEVQGELRVALIWRAGEYADFVEGQPVEPYHIAEDVPVTTELPARFTLELTEPPPEFALRHITEDTNDTDFPPGSSYAIGALVVYDDRNGNGALDLLDAYATEDVDALVGARGDLEVWYVAGGVPRTGHLDGGGQYDFLQLGYQVVEWDGESGRLLDSVDLPLVVEETVRSIVCANPFGAPFRIEDKGFTAPDAYPVEGDSIECYPDGTRFEWDRTGCRVTHWDYLCPPNDVCPIEIYWLRDPTAPPEGWPCEVTAPPTE